MGSPSSPDHPRTLLPAIVAAGIAIVGLLLSFGGETPFLWFAAVLTLLVARELMVLLAGGEERFPGWAIAFAAAIFPLAVGRWGLPGATVAVALAAPLIASRLVVRGIAEGALRLTAVGMFVALYVGLFGGYLVLVREQLGVNGSGTEFLGALVLMIAGYHLGTWSGDRYFGGPRVVPLPWVPTWAGAGLGLAGSVAGGMASVLFLADLLALPSLSILGLVVGLASVAGELAAGLVFSEGRAEGRRATIPGYGGLFVAVQTALLAAPAFFFAFRLYLV